MASIHMRALNIINQCTFKDFHERFPKHDDDDFLTFRTKILNFYTSLDKDNEQIFSKWIDDTVKIITPKPIEFETYITESGKTRFRCV